MEGNHFFHFARLKSSNFDCVFVVLGLEEKKSMVQ
jgi:hypothetical protein